MKSKLLKQLVMAGLLSSGLVAGTAFALTSDERDGKRGSTSTSTQSTGSSQTTADSTGAGTGGSGSGSDKVTVCHKGKKTLSIGAPALDAHLGHGDTQGACGSATGGSGTGTTDSSGTGGSGGSGTGGTGSGGAGGLGSGGTGST
ncbi:MAG TPA: hypothetical protein VE153_35465, partial [Myxococcus sp.]|nr:hypothetical protein [Myxococcus sp.]